MSSLHHAGPMLCVVAVLVFAHPDALSVGADDKAKTGGTVSGIVMDRREGSITVKADGEDEPAKYVFDPADKKAVQALEGIFTVGRVQLKYKQNGETRQLVGIRKQVLKAEGTITGEVVQSHDWWVEVKPKNGQPDGYAVHFPTDQNKAVMDKVKALKPGDVVTIRFTTDFERHRIEAIQKKATPKK